MMYAEYFYWQFVVGPRWLVEFTWNVQRAIIRLFSVPVMLKTLFAHWHRDVVPYKGGTFTSYAMTFAWNQISRGVGFCVRSVVLIAWLATEILFLAIAVSFFVAFMAWPLLVIGMFVTGIGLLAA